MVIAIMAVKHLILTPFSPLRTQRGTTITMTSCTYCKLFASPKGMCTLSCQSQTCQTICHNSTRSKNEGKNAARHRWCGFIASL